MTRALPLLPLAFCACMDPYAYVESREHIVTDPCEIGRNATEAKARARYWMAEEGIKVIRGRKLPHLDRARATPNRVMLPHDWDEKTEGYQAVVLWHELTHNDQFNDIPYAFLVDADWKWAIETNAYATGIVAAEAVGASSVIPKLREFLADDLPPWVSEEQLDISVDLWEELLENTEVCDE